ncbi:peptide ABC transporter permease [Flavonifractor sp. An135]|uniref:ABC transporter permease n=1 Tax=Flavonifractor sp. An92 TaxID=1965666 RepID=UPI000B375415|nr:MULTISPECIES: ABC transporter permease [unclassified Flavonifractor]OUQ26387.1 peptide ABC transporter permease [Flavonifractor sp. An135]
MLRYVLKRIAYGILTLFVLITLTFFMMRALPGDPFIGDKTPSPTTLANMEAKYGLDKPPIVQYFIFLGNCVRGDLGVSISYENRSVNEIILSSFPISMDLGARAILFAMIAGILLGAVAAVKRGSITDSLSMFIAIVGVSVPSFILGALLQYFLAVKLRLVPVQGWGTFAQTLLPSFALGMSSLATISRLMRTSMLDVLSQDYIKTAKAKGLSQSMILWRHALRNAIMPVITIIGPTVAAVFTGSFVVESIFNIPGLGKYFVTSIKDKDFTMISGTTIFYGALLILCTLVVDLLYGVVDPRVKLED